MPDMWMDVDTAVQVPANKMPLVDRTDFITIEDAIAYNESGIAIAWNFVTTAGVMTTTAITPTTSDDHDWLEEGTNQGMYSIEIPASGGDANNDTEGFGWISGETSTCLPFCGPTIGFRAAALNNALIDGGDNLDVNVAQWLGTACATPTVAGVPEVDLTHMAGGTQTVTDLKDFADAGYDPSTNKVQGVVLTDTCTTLTDHTAQSGDGYAIINGTHGLVSIQDDIDAILVDTNSLNDTKIPDTISLANINTQCDTALADIHLDHLFHATYDPASKPGAADALLNEVIENDGGVSRFTENALEQGPSGSGGDATEAKQDTIIAAIGTPANIDSGGATIADNIKKIADDNGGLTFDAETDSLNKIRDDRTIAAADYTVVGDLGTVQSADNNTILSSLTIANGAVDSKITYIMDTILTEGGAGRLAAALIAYGDVASPVFTSASVNQSANNNTILANGSYGLSAIEAKVDTAITDVGNLNNVSAADVNAQCDAAIETYKLDHLISAAAAEDEVSDNSVIARLAATGGDWSEFNDENHSLEALRVRGDAAWTTGSGGDATEAKQDTLIAVIGALNDAAAAGEVTSADTLMQYIKQLINILIGTPGIGAFPAEASPGNAVSLAEVIRAIHADVTGLNGDAMRGTEGANTTTPPTVAQIQAEMEENGASILDTLRDDLTDGGRLDLLIDAIKAKADNLPADPASETNVNANETKIDTAITDIGNLNNISTADVNAQCDAAIETYKLDHLISAAAAADEVADNSIIARLAATEGDWSEYNDENHSLEALRVRGDAAWSSGASNPNVLLEAEVATVGSQTSFTLTSGSDEDDAYNDQAIVLYDDSNSDYPSVRVISDYTGASKTVTIDSGADFTLGTDDSVKIFVTAPGTSAPTAAQVADAVWDEAQADHVGAGTFGVTASEIADILTDTGTTIPGTITTAQSDLDTITGADGATLATAQGNYAPNKVVPDVAGTAATPAEVATALSNYDAPTKAEMDTAHGLLATEAKQDIIDTNIDQIETAVITNAAGTDIAADIIAIKAETATIVADTNELQSDNIPGTLSTIDGKIDTIDNFLDTEVAAILTDTGTTLPATLSTIEGKIDTVDGIVDNILTDTGTTLPATLTTIDNFLDTEVAAILTDTGTTLPATLSTIEGKIDTVDGIVDNILTDTGTTIPATLTTIDNFLDTEVAAILEDTGTTLPATLSTIEGKIDTVDNFLDTEISELTTQGDTNETKLDTIDGIVDSILTDTGTTLPATLTTIEGKIDTVDTVVDAIKAKTDNQPAGVPKNVALSNFTFLMVDDTDGKTPETGLTVTCTISKDGGSFASCTNSAAEIANGFYRINLTQTEMNADFIVLSFANAAARTTVVAINTSA